MYINLRTCTMCIEDGHLPVISNIVSNEVRPTRFSAAHSYLPWSSLFTLWISSTVLFSCNVTRPVSSSVSILSSFLNQMILGCGTPEKLHCNRSGSPNESFNTFPFSMFVSCIAGSEVGTTCNSHVLLTWLSSLMIFARQTYDPLSSIVTGLQRISFRCENGVLCGITWTSGNYIENGIIKTYNSFETYFHENTYSCYFQLEHCLYTNSILWHIYGLRHRMSLRYHHQRKSVAHYYTK